MSLAELSITQQDLEQYPGVSNLPDTPGLTGEEMRAAFEQTGRELLVPRYNSLIEALSAMGDPVVSESIKGLRLDSLGQLEVSFDGNQWQKVTSAPTADAEKLGGQPPSYYATAEGLAAAEEQAQQASDGAAAAQQTADAAMPKAGGQFTGEVNAVNTSRSGLVLRNCGVWLSDAANQTASCDLRFIRK